MPLFTPELGSQLARKRWEICPTHSRPEPELIPHDANGLVREPNQAREIDRMLRIIEEQIASTRARLNAEPREYCLACEQPIEMPDHHRAQLLKSLDALIERKSKLLGIPDPGCLKPSSKPSRGQSYPTLDPKPIEPVREPIAQPVSQPQSQPQSGPVAKP